MKNKLASTGFVYLVSSMIGQLINLVLMNIYTNYMNVELNGQLNIVLSFQSLFTIFITLGIYSGLARFYNEYEDKNSIKNTALTFSILWGILIIVLFAVISPFISPLLFGDDSNGIWYLLYTVVTSILMCIISIYNIYYSMQYKSIKSSMITLMRIIFIYLLTAYLMIIRSKSIMGALQAQLAAALIICAALFIADIKNVRLRLKRKELKDMLTYGLALTPGQTSSWILTLIDRYFLRGMFDLKMVAIYSIGYKIGTLIDPVLVAPFRSAFTPYKFDVYKNPGGKEKIQQAYKYFCFCGWFIIVLLSLFSNFVILFITNKEYANSYKVVPLIAFSYFLWGLVEFYGFGLHIANKMIISSGIVVFSAVVNIALNFLLIPSYNMYGAAVATIVAYFMANILYYVAGKKYYNIHLNIMEPLKYGIIFIIVYGAYLFFKGFINNIFIEMLLGVILTVVYLALNFLFKFIDIKIVTQIINFVRKRN